MNQTKCDNFTGPYLVYILEYGTTLQKCYE